MKYLVGLFVGLGLMTYGQAFANEWEQAAVVFQSDYISKSLKPCVNAAENGIELNTIKIDGMTAKRWLHADKIYNLVIEGSENGAQVILRCVIMSPE